MTTPTWPLYFCIRRPIEGRGCVASVRIIGRATWTLDFGKTWLYGVNPGAMAGCGQDLDGALRDFTEHLTGVLADFADGAEDLDSFRRTVERFVNATDDDSVVEWDAARERVRSGRGPDVSLAREVRELAAGVEVQPASPESGALALATEASLPRIAA